MVESTAASTVVTTPELLEMILLQRTLTEILQAQRVCSTWRDVIKTSPQLQCALFFRPSVEPPLRYIHNDLKVLDCVDQTQCENDEGRGEHPQDASARWARDPSDTHSHENFISNPFIASKIPWLMPMVFLGMDGIPRDSWRVTRGLRPEASWRKMLVTQPALSEVALDMGGFHWHRATPRAGELGVMLGGLHQRMETYGRSVFQVLGSREAFRALEPLHVWQPLQITASKLLREMTIPSKTNHMRS